MELNYDENNHNRNDHPLKPFKILNGNYEFSNILDMHQKSKLMKTEQLAEAFGQEFKTKDKESESEILANLKAIVKKIYENQVSKSCIIVFKFSKMLVKFHKSTFLFNGLLVLANRQI